MANVIKLKPHVARFIKLYELNDPAVPAGLKEKKPVKPDLTKIEYPLPVKKRDFTCFDECDGIFWYGSEYGLVRYDENAEFDYDKIMYFSAHRDLKDNHVKSVLADRDGVWVMTSSGASRIDMKTITCEQKANILLDECVNIVSRMGFVSQRNLRVPGDISTPEKFAVSDNDGGFTAAFCMGELMHYDILRKTKGEDDPETKKIKDIAVKSLEACLLLAYIPGRADGFIARTFLTPDAPIPDDGIFIRRTGDKSVVLNTTFAEHKGLVGMEIDSPDPIPERLRRVYRDAGYSDDNLVYKADTSSDETTLHMMNICFAHKIIGGQDKELDDIMMTAVERFVDHVIDNDFEFVDFHGEPTSWAKWSPRYFAEGLGWVDSCLNSAEVMMYISMAQYLLGENKKRTDAYNHLIEIGYPDLTAKHYDRSLLAGNAMKCDVIEDIMFGDHMLVTMSYLGLFKTEKNEELRKKFKAGYMSWINTSIGREHHPVYDIPFMVSCPEEDVDTDKLAMWFYRFNTSTLASGVSLTSRYDIAKKLYRAGYAETSILLPPDEKFISKYDRNPLEYKNEDSYGNKTVESCAQYTLAYWMGRYFGIITEE